MNVGQVIAFSYQGVRFEGRVVNVQDGVVVVKLENGYNIGVPQKDLQGVEVLQDVKTGKDVPGEEGGGRDGEGALPARGAGKNASAATPSVRIVHTGGTIACRVDYATGAVIASFSPEELLDLFPELGKLATLSAVQVMNTQSEFMRFSDYNRLARGVERAVQDGVDGVVITHGTDTMHFTAAALAFALEGLPIPVVLVGSQRSADRGSSDNYVNLTGALTFIKAAKAAKIAPGVYVAMHAGIDDRLVAVHKGVRARKMHTSRRDAFRSINDRPVALVDPEEGRIEWVAKPSGVEKKQSSFRLVLFREDVKVGLLRTRPGMFAEEFSVFESFDGLIVEGSGLGHAPIGGGLENERIKEALGRLAQKMPVVMTSQCVYGRVNLRVYSPGRELLKMGLLGDGLDMTSECAYVKLAWLLSWCQKREDVVRLFGSCLRGEFSERSQEDEFENMFEPRSSSGAEKLKKGS